MKLFKRNFQQNTLEYPFQHNNDSSKENTLAFHRARPVITSPPFVKFSLQRSTLGNLLPVAKTERQRDVSTTVDGWNPALPAILCPLNFNFGFTWKVVQDFSHSEIPMFHVLHHHNVKIEGAGKQLLTKSGARFRPYWGTRDVGMKRMKWQFAIEEHYWRWV